MDLLCCVGLFYLYAQSAVMFNSWKLLRWDDPKWKRFRNEDKPESLKTFALAWLVITPLIMFLDVGIISIIVRLLSSDNPPPLFNAIPFLGILLLATFAKTQFIHMCWLTWRTELLKERFNRKN